MDNEVLEHLEIALTQGVVKIKFEKKDGSLREMNATLNPKLIIEYEKKTDKTRTVNPEIMSVFDVDLNEWRSFRKNSLKEININT